MRREPRDRAKLPPLTLVSSLPKGYWLGGPQAQPLPGGTGPPATQTSLFGHVPPQTPCASSPQGCGVVGTHSQPLSSGLVLQNSAAVGQSPPQRRMPTAPHGPSHLQLPVAAS